MTLTQQNVLNIPLGDLSPMAGIWIYILMIHDTSKIWVSSCVSRRPRLKFQQVASNDISFLCKKLFWVPGRTEEPPRQPFNLLGLSCEPDTERSTEIRVIRQIYERYINMLDRKHPQWTYTTTHI